MGTTKITMDTTKTIIRQSYRQDKDHNGYDKDHNGYDKDRNGYDKDHIGYDKDHNVYDKDHIGYDKDHNGYDNGTSIAVAGGSNNNVFHVLHLHEATISTTKALPRRGTHHE
ncbi:hypothetical protein RJ55_04284 [Drechmeria coniospora]|nr:hypothetical protein RJ55_04284 [Drechmeria coniospora]